MLYFTLLLSFYPLILVRLLSSILFCSQLYRWDYFFRGFSAGPTFFSITSSSSRASNLFGILRLCSCRSSRLNVNKGNFSFLFASDLACLHILSFCLTNLICGHSNRLICFGLVNSMEFMYYIFLGSLY